MINMKHKNKSNLCKRTAKGTVRPCPDERTEKFTSECREPQFKAWCRTAHCLGSIKGCVPEDSTQHQEYVFAKTPTWPLLTQKICKLTLLLPKRFRYVLIRFFQLILITLLVLLGNYYLILCDLLFRLAYFNLIAKYTCRMLAQAWGQPQPLHLLKQMAE